MAMEMLNYADLAARLKVSPEAARALAKRLRLPRARGNDGKALVSVDLAEINHAPLPARSPAGHQAVNTLKAKIETLQAELAKLEAVAGGHRADFEWERDQGQKLMAEFLKMIAVTMTAKEATARLEGELAALKARPWWRRLAVTSSYLSRQWTPLDPERMGALLRRVIGLRQANTPKIAELEPVLQNIEFALRADQANRKRRSQATALRS
jgi:hypothetical protein